MKSKMHFELNVSFQLGPQLLTLAVITLELKLSCWLVV